VTCQNPGPAPGGNATEAGDIGYSDDTPEVEVQVPDNIVPDVTEYAYGFWFRFQYRIPQRLDIQIARNSYLAVAGVSENDGWSQASNPGDRALATYYVAHNEVQRPTYRFSTYAENSDIPESHKTIGLTWETFEGTWYYIYCGYSYARETASAYVRSDDAATLKGVQLTNKKHRSPLKALYFSFGSDTGYNVNGLYADLQFLYRAGAYASSNTDFGGWFLQHVNAHPVIVPPSFRGKVICLMTLNYNANPIPVIEPAAKAQAVDYAVWGWAKWRADCPISPQHLLWRLTINKDPVDDARYLGDRTLGVWIDEDGNFVFAGYNFKFKDGGDQVSNSQSIAFKDFLTEPQWAFLYFGYQRSTRTGTAYLRTASIENHVTFPDV